jgi:tRNA-modifying protein YgfZ
LTALPAYPIHEAVSNVHAAAGAPSRLQHLGILRFAGPDAVNFLQGQVSNDTRRLNEGAPLLAAYSNSQGRTIAVLHLLPHSSGVIALLPRDLAASTAERLRKFVLRAKVKVENLSDEYAVVGAHDAASLCAAGLEAPDAGKEYTEQDGVGVGRVRSVAEAGSSRYWIVGPAGTVERRLAGLGGGLDAERDWRLADIRDGSPQVYAATSELFVAQMLNLDLLDGISFSKGCYTGQEIIARTQHLGRIKRRMFRLKLPRGAWSIGQPLVLADGRAGRLTELASVGDEYEALAVLNLETGSAQGEGETVSAADLPLPYRHDAVKDQ